MTITAMCLDLTFAKTGKSPAAATIALAAATIALSIETEETLEKRIERLVAESPVVVLSRKGCCMSHVMRMLLGSVGVHPTVIELDEIETEEGVKPTVVTPPPTVFIGGELVGGVENLMGLHLRGELVPRLKEAGALWV